MGESKVRWEFSAVQGDYAPIPKLFKGQLYYAEIGLYHSLVCFSHMFFVYTTYVGLQIICNVFLFWNLTQAISKHLQVLTTWFFFFLLNIVLDTYHCIFIHVSICGFSSAFSNSTVFHCNNKLHFVFSFTQERLIFYFLPSQQCYNISCVHVSLCIRVSSE